MSQGLTEYAVLGKQTNKATIQIYLAKLRKHSYFNTLKVKIIINLRKNVTYHIIKEILTWILVHTRHL